MSSAPPFAGASQWLEDHLRQSVAASNNEISRIRVELDKSNNRAKRWREKAEQAEEQTKRFRDDVDDAIRLKHSLEFEALCVALRRNDSATTTVECSCNFPLGYGESLGKALHRNTHVSSILLRLNELIPHLEDGRYAATQIERGLRPLLHFISTSKSMRRVVVNEPHPDNSNSTCEILTELLLKAIFTNRDNIEDLALTVSRIPVVEFERYMRSTMLQTLDVNFGNSCEYDFAERLMIGEAFRQSASLRTLSLHSYDSRLIWSILVGLSNGTDQYQLRNLRVTCLDETQTYCTVLTQFLIMKGPLDALYLESTRYDFASMTHLIDGLKGGNGSTTITSVSKLTFDYCTFDADAKALLTDFMHTRANVSDSVSSLRELAFVGEDGFMWSGSNLVGLICLQRDHENEQTSTELALNLHATIGSQVQQLAVSTLVDSFPGFLRSMTTYARQIRLVALSICGIDKDHSTDFLECISKVSSLRDLTVEEAEDLHLLVAHLKRSGSNLHNVSFLEHGDTIECRLVGAYTARNQLLEPLLSTSLESAPTPQRIEPRSANQMTA